MKIKLLCMGNTFQPFIKEGCKMYEDRLKHYINFEIVEIADIKKAGKLPVAELKKKEAEEFLKKIGPADRVVLLDEKGKRKSSKDFADFLQKEFLGGQKQTVFLIGGAFGFSEEIYQRANYQLSLSPMTFSHQMIRLFFTEQVYRAMTILKNESYHNE